MTEFFEPFKACLSYGIPPGHDIGRPRVGSMKVENRDTLPLGRGGLSLEEALDLFMVLVQQQKDFSF